MSQLVIFRKLKVQNANAISSPFTYGIPAVTAFLGFVHALERKFNKQQAHSVCVHGVGIVCHRMQMQDHRAGYDRTLCLTANPLNEKGERAAFIEEGRCHLTVSLVLEVDGMIGGDRDADAMLDLCRTSLKLGGGDILSIENVLCVLDDRHAIRKLMPGYALIERRSLMKTQMEQGDDALEALHRFTSLHHHSSTSPEGVVSWATQRQSKGWIVPIATGFHAVSPEGFPRNARDEGTPHRFAESVVTLGEFVMATRFQSLRELLWRYRHHGDLYVCEQETLAM